MRVISKRKLKEFWQKHPRAEIPLDSWYKVMTKNQYRNLVELKETFPSADLVNGLIVFNIAGNHFRLIAASHFNTGTIYVRNVLAHAEYDKGKWKS